MRWDVYDMVSPIQKNWKIVKQTFNDEIWYTSLKRRVAVFAFFVVRSRIPKLMKAFMNTSKIDSFFGWTVRFVAKTLLLLE